MKKMRQVTIATGAILLILTFIVYMRSLVFREDPPKVKAAIERLEAEEKERQTNELYHLDFSGKAKSGWKE